MFTLHRFLMTLSVVGLLLSVSLVQAQVGDPTIKTDHPFYPGEGAFQTIEDCVTAAVQDEKQTQKQAIQLFQWMLTHQFHLHSPQEWNIPSVTPGAEKTNYDMVVYDANRARFSYAYGLCGTVHAWNEPYWKVLGMQARRRSFPGHTNSEIQYDGSWHTFDTDMAGLVFRPDGVVAGYEDIIKNPALVKPTGNKIPCYPFAWPGDFNGMKKGWQQVSQGGKWFKMYNSGYAAQPGIVNLRMGETFTRYFDRDHFGGPSKRRFWHQQNGGPYRDWTFVNRGTPKHDEKQSNSRGNASYCNAVFEYEPNLTNDSFREGVTSASANIAFQSKSPNLFSKNGEPATVTFQHFSPYVICGDPVDDADPMTKPATDGLVVSGKTNGSVKLEVSADYGQTWKAVSQASGAFKEDLTEQIKGRYGWQVRFSFSGSAGLESLKFETTTQVSQIIYPRLTSNGSQVTYRTNSRKVTPVIPNFALSEKEIARYEVQSQRSSNVRYEPRAKKQRYVYKTTNNKPGTVVFKIEADTPLEEITAAVRFGVRVPSPDGCDYHLDYSSDGGKTWKPLGKADVPTDNEYSSGWMYGKADVSKAKTNSALVRCHFYAGGYQTGLITAELYGISQALKRSPVTLTYGWKEDGKSKFHRENLPTNKPEWTITIPTGKEIKDDFIRLAPRQ